MKKIMKKIININNREEIVEQLAEMLVSFAKARNLYQTDVYLYYDEATCTASLDKYENVGGNSWLDDAHYTIYIDRPHYDDEECDDECIDEAYQDFYHSADRILSDWEGRSEQG